MWIEEAKPCFAIRLETGAREGWHGRRKGRISNHAGGEIS